jgi:hypothetical protein
MEKRGRETFDPATKLALRFGHTPKRTTRPFNHFSGHENIAPIAVRSHSFPRPLPVFAPVAESRAEDVILSQFNDAGGLSGWRFDYGGVTNLIEFDATQDASNNPASGSMKVTFGFDAAVLNPVGNNKGAVTIDLSPPLDGSTYLTLEMDVRVETGSAADGAGNSGFFQMVIRNTANYDFNSQFGANLSTNTGWRHISVPPSGGRDDIHAITLELFGGAALTGPVTFYIDNVKFTKPSSVTDVVIGQFNNSGGLAGWRFDYGGVTNSIAFDASQDASNNPASGSMKVTFGFDAAALHPTDNNKGAIAIDLPTPLDGSAYSSMEMDIKIATGSAADGSGNSGYFQMVIRNGGFYDFFSQFGDDVSTNSGWRHLRAAPLTGEVNDIRAITLELYGGAGLTGPVTFYVDNLKFTTTAAPPTAPTLGTEHPVRGLNLIPTSGQYQRQNISTIPSSGFTWIGSADPVTYATTIHRYPDASHNGMQTHIFLVAGSSGTASDPDYSQPNVVFLDIQNRPDGTAAAAFRYKINEPQGNDFLYHAGTLGTVTNPTPLGNWSMTFSLDTNVNVTAPGGNTGNFVLPPAAAEMFGDPLTVYIGAQANAGGNVGQTVVLSRFQVQFGAATLLDDNFLTDEVLDPATWRVAAGNAAGVRLVGSGAAFWLNWTTPDSGFRLQNTPTPTEATSWMDTGWIATQMGSLKRILVYFPTANPDPNITYLPDPNHSFFRLVK